MTAVEESSPHSLPVGFVPFSRLCRVSVVAAQLGISERTISRCIEDNGVPVYLLQTVKFVNWDDIVRSMGYTPSTPPLTQSPS